MIKMSPEDLERKIDNCHSESSVFRDDEESQCDQILRKNAQDDNENSSLRASVARVAIDFSEY